MYQAIEKPWGKEEILELNDNYMLKRLTMLKGHRCSLQYHNNKCESIYILSGELKILFGKDKNNLTEKIFKKNEVITIKPFEVHRMEAITDSIYLEASTPNPDDTIRIIDDYDRN